MQNENLLRLVHTTSPRTFLCFLCFSFKHSLAISLSCDLQNQHIHTEGTSISENWGCYRSTFYWLQLIGILLNFIALVRHFFKRACTSLLSFLHFCTSPNFPLSSLFNSVTVNLQQSIYMLILIQIRRVVLRQILQSFSLCFDSYYCTTLDCTTQSD